MSKYKIRASKLKGFDSQELQRKHKKTRLPLGKIKFTVTQVTLLTENRKKMRPKHDVQLFLTQKLARFKNAYENAAVPWSNAKLRILAQARRPTAQNVKSTLGNKS